MNYDLFNKVFIFFGGAAVGSAVTWKLIKTKYEHIAQEEIDSVKEVFKRRLKEDRLEECEEPEETCYNPETDELEDYEKVLDGAGYRNYSTKKEEKEECDVCEPYVISPEEFDENEDYETVSLTYYADGVLTDEFGNVIEDVEGMVGKESLTHFGEYEEDSVFVRNDSLKTDYEILRDTYNYSDTY